MPNQKKVELISELREKIKKAKSIVFADYSGLKSNEMNELRQQIKDVKGEAAIAKNTLLKRALDDEGIKDENIKSDLKGLTVAFFGFEDAIAPIKTLFDFVKRTDLPKVKGGFIEGIYNEASQIQILSQLPSREVMISKILGSLKSPLFILSLFFQV